MNREKKLEAIIAISAGLLTLYVAYSNVYFVYGSLAIGLLGLFVKPMTNAISWFWYKIGEYLGFVTSKILLTVVFYCLLFPLAILSSVFSKRKGGFNKSIRTAYTRRAHVYSRRDLENPW